MELEGVAAVYSSATVEKDIRDFFKAERKRLGLTQKDVAVNGAIEQSTISKIERDAPYEPSVSIFVKAVRGLGMTPAGFFARFEQRGRRTGTVMVEQTRKSGLNRTDELAQNAVPPIPEAAHHGDPLPASIHEEDIRAFFRILQQALGGSVLDAISDAGGRKTPARPHAKKARSR